MLDCEIGAPLAFASAGVCKYVGPPFFGDRLLRARPRATGDSFTRRIRGTYNPQAKYSVNDVVAKEGGSFIARKNDPGPRPGDDWQLMAKQGARGIAGPKGDRGSPGKTIASWVVDRSTYVVIPRFDDGSLGPSLDLRALFEDNTA